MLLYDFLEECSNRYPQKIALVQKEERGTYREIDEKADQVTRFLRHPGVLPSILPLQANIFIANQGFLSSRALSNLIPWNKIGSPSVSSRTNPPTRDLDLATTLHRGDLFRAEQQSFLRFVARKDDLIKARGGAGGPQRTGMGASAGHIPHFSCKGIQN